MKTYRLEISKFIYSFLLSLIFFSVFWKEVCLNLYLLIYVSVFFLALILLEHKKNAEHLFRLMILGTSISIGYAIAKLLIGNINVTALYHRECGIVAYRIIVIIIIGINLAMENEELTSKNNRKIIIAFYYLKNFMWQLYEQISFNKNLQDEIKFERHVEDHGIKKNSYYSIMELIDLSKKKIIKADEINKMFTYNEKEVEKSVIWNRNKLALLNMFGFNFQYLQRYYEYMGSTKEKRVDNAADILRECERDGETAG